MLVPLQTGGRRTPLILVHGMFGVLPWRRGQALAEFLGADQPLYGIEASGFDGSRKPRTKVPETANEYLAEMRRARLKPPFVVTGVCGGCIMALQLAQNLAVAAQYAGDPPPVPLLILIDPPTLPGHAFNPSDLAGASELLRGRVSGWFQEARSRLEVVPFDIDDPKQLAIATDVGATLEWSISTYHPAPYAGRVQVLAIEPIANMVDRPHWPWRKVLVGDWGLRTLQCQHHEIFTIQAPEVFRWIKGQLDDLTATAGGPSETRPAAGP
jgi:hypothetical protein